MTICKTRCYEHGYEYGDCVHVCICEIIEEVRAETKNQTKWRMKIDMKRIGDAFAGALEAKAEQILTTTRQHLQEQWELGYRSGYERGKSKREERRRAAAARGEDTSHE